MSLALPVGTTPIQIAGVGFRFRVSPTLPEAVRLPPHFRRFLASHLQPAPQEVVFEPGHANDRSGDVLYESKLNWRARRAGEALRYEWYHRASGATLILTEWQAGSRTIRIRFDLEQWKRIGEEYWRGEANRSLALLPPFEQLPFVAPLIRNDVVLVHASGAVRDGRAYVFAGHSGDGKTTISRLLAAEGFQILSDERVAIRLNGRSFVAFGTPWPGEGDVANASGYALAGVFLLHKGIEHEIRDGSKSMLATELLARTLVPYYLPTETEITLSLLGDLTHEIPLKELHFARKRGLSHILVPGT